MIIRVMGEIEIHCFEQKGETASADKLSALTSIDSPGEGDIVNWLGKALDDAGAPSLEEDASWREQVEIAASILAAPALAKGP